MAASPTFTRIGGSKSAALQKAVPLPRRSAESKCRFMGDPLWVKKGLCYTDEPASSARVYRSESPENKSLGRLRRKRSFGYLRRLNRNRMIPACDDEGLPIPILLQG